MADITASVMPAIKLCKIADLQFGTFVSGTPGTITIDPTGSRTASGPILISSANSPVGAATFTVDGSSHFDFTIMLPSSVTLNGPSGSKMTLTKFVSSPSGHGTIPSKGSGTISVGATLTVGGNQTPGAYYGTFSVTVHYE